MPGFVPGAGGRSSSVWSASSYSPITLWGWRGLTGTWIKGAMAVGGALQTGSLQMTSLRPRWEHPAERAGWPQDASALSTLSEASPEAQCLQVRKINQQVKWTLWQQPAKPLNLSLKCRAFSYNWTSYWDYYEEEEEEEVSKLWLRRAEENKFPFKTSQ